MNLSPNYMAQNFAYPPSPQLCDCSLIISRCQVCPRRYNCFKYHTYLLENINTDVTVDNTAVLSAISTLSTLTTTQYNDLKQTVLNQFLVTNTKIDNTQTAIDTVNTKVDEILAILQANPAPAMISAVGEDGVPVEVSMVDGNSDSTGLAVYDSAVIDSGKTYEYKKTIFGKEKLVEVKK